MQKFKLLLGSLALMGATIEAQVKFDYSDLSKAAGTIVTPAESGQFTTLCINNINTFLFKVEIDGQVVQLETPIPTELQTLFRLSTEQLNDGAEQAKEGLEDSREAVNEVSKQVNKTQNSLLKTQLEELEQECVKYLEQMQKVAEGIAQIKLVRMKLVNLAKEDFPSNKMIQEANAIHSIITGGLEAVYLNFEELYFKLENSYDKTVNQTTGDEQKTMKNALKAIEKGYKKIDGEQLLALISEVDLLYNALSNPKNYQVVSPPIQMDGDYSEFTIKVTPTAVNTLGPYRNAKTWTVQIPAKKGWKADFGVGPALSFGKGARDERYYLALPDSMIVKANDNNNAVYPGIAAMMHFYPRTGTYIAYGFTMGVGAGFKSFNEVDASAYLGGSIVLGKYRKIAISAGVSYLRVNRLISPQYQKDQKYPGKIPDVNGIMEKVYRPSLFLATSYSIASRTVVK